MPKILTYELDELVRIVSRYPDGVAPREILKCLSAPIPERTLLSHLAKLRKHERLIRTGRGPSTLYLIPPRPEKATTQERSAVEAAEAIPLSNEALRIKKKLMIPMEQRAPVGYDRTLLDHYSPNSTYYLPVKVRQELKNNGSVMADDQPAGTYLRKICDRLLVDLAWNSSRLEGNTYSLLETEVLLERGRSAEGKDIKETQMILNHKAAVELLCDQASQIGFNRHTICNLHAVLSDNLLSDPGACGRIRTRTVRIGGSVFEPVDVPQLVEECLDLILMKASAIDDPFEQAFFVMVHLPYLQPFEDVNKRVSRFAANIPFIRKNLCPLSFIDVPEADYTRGTLGVYELKEVDYLRDVFIWAYRRSCARYSAIAQSMGEPNSIRLKYRELIKGIVQKAVLGRLSKEEAVRFIKDSIPHEIDSHTTARLFELIEIELSNLLECNIARYGLKESDFDAWRKTWH